MGIKKAKALKIVRVTIVGRVFNNTKLIQLGIAEQNRTEHTLQ